MTAPARDVIREFVTARYPHASLADDDDIFALGFVNSLFAMELVMFLETTFGMTVPNQDLTLDNFRTVDAMAALVERQAPSALGQ